VVSAHRFDDRLRSFATQGVSMGLGLIGVTGTVAAAVVVATGRLRYSNLEGSLVVPLSAVGAFVLFDVLSALRRVSEVRTQARWSTRMALVVAISWAPLVLVTLACSLIAGLIRRGDARRILPASLTSTGAAVVAALIFRQFLAGSHQLASGIHLWNGTIAFGALVAISSAIVLSLIAGARQSFIPGNRLWNLSWTEQLARAFVDLLFAVLGLGAINRAATDITLFPLTLALIVGVGLLARNYWVTTLDALTDPLTGVLSRSGFISRAEKRVQASGARGVLCVADLNDFKLLNDQFGRDVGDSVLQEVAGRLVRVANSGDLVGRLSGDEFGFLATLTSPEDEHALLSRLTEALEGVVDVAGVSFSIGASLGVARYPLHGTSFHALMGCADTAMNEAKHLGRGLVIYRPDHTPARLGRLSLVAELARAVENEELYLDYQPRIEVATGKIVSCEALVRWSHPSLGVVPPSEFIPVAEHTEIMGVLTTYVLERAFRDCVWWRAQGLEIGVSVNGSARNLGDVSWVRSLGRAVRNSGLPSRQIEIEITENAIFLDPLKGLAMIQEIRAMGIGVSLDDFGTGYSSLSVLRDIPITHIKIDMSFIIKLLSSRQNLEIVRSVVGLAQSLGIETVAEGVESVEILNVLRELGVGYVQGYLLSRPVDRAEILRFGRERGQLIELGSESR